MIVDPARTVVLSSVGWVDGDALWRLDVASRRVDALPLGTGARWARLHHEDGDRFAVDHGFDGARFEVSVRSFDRPATVLARAVVEPGRAGLEGDAAAWIGVRQLYVPYLRFEPWRDSVLVRVVPDAGRIDVQRLSWFDDSYDKDYEAPIDVIASPDRSTAIVSVQRRSRLILQDLASGTVRGAVELADRGGNPELRLRASGRELWASDYDTIAVVRTADWQVDRSALVQSEPARNSQLFIGDYGFAPDADLCVVARPYSGDIVAIDPATLKIVQTAKTGKQPLQVAAVGEGRVIARDWKSGELLSGTLSASRRSRWLPW
jgi:hypothetical protein